MKISLDWLSQHIDVSELPVPELADRLTFAGVEVEEIEQTRIHDNVVVAEVLRIEPHPNADKLTVCQVQHGEATSQIVCGAKNFEVGDKVPLARPGAVLAGGMKIKKGKLRGVASEGMMCSANELGLSMAADGLLVLGRDVPIGEKLSTLFRSDTCLTLEVTPNRPDWLSHLGIAREVAAVTSLKLKTSAIVESAQPTQPAGEDEIIVDSDSCCQFYTARRIRGAKVGPSPEWLQRRLETIGLRPINNVVDITNFVLMDMGQPLHAFDVEKLQGGIHVRRSHAAEKLVALDGQTYQLHPDDTVIADQKQGLAIAGVMGGEASGVTETTTDILLESAYFEPRKVRKTSHRLALSSDSSYRFERGVDPHQVVGASELATKLILEIAGGEADPATLTAGKLPTSELEVELDHARCRRLLGVDIGDGQITENLTQLGLGMTSLNAGISTWSIPSYRLDLVRPVDLIEEVVRLSGLDPIPSGRASLSSDPRPEDSVYDLEMKLKRRLVTLGFCETPTLSMVSQAQVNDAVMGQHDDVLPIKNPLGSDYRIMRTTMLSGLAVHELSSGLLNVASRNANLGSATARLFELGSVYDSAHEATVLSILMAGEANEVGWMTPRPRALTVHDLRGVIEALLPNTSLRVRAIEETRLALAADVIVNRGGDELVVGQFGQCAPHLCRRIGYETVVVAELRMSSLQQLLSSATRYRDVSPYPAITRDVAMEVDVAVSNQSVSDFFASRDEALLESYSLFDVFSDPTGEKLDASKKSLAYSLTYRAADRTLESKTVDQAHAKLLKALQDQLGVSIR